MYTDTCLYSVALQYYAELCMLYTIIHLFQPHTHSVQPYNLLCLRACRVCVCRVLSSRHQACTGFCFVSFASRAISRFACVRLPRRMRHKLLGPLRALIQLSGSRFEYVHARRHSDVRLLAANGEITRYTPRSCVASRCKNCGQASRRRCRLRQSYGLRLSCVTIKCQSSI